MKRFLVSLLVSLVVCPGGSGGVEQKSPNLVRNPGLEIDADGDHVPDHWSAPKPQDYPPDWHVGAGGMACGVSNIARSGRQAIAYSRVAADTLSIGVADWWDYSAWEKAADSTQDHWAVAFKTDDFPVKEYHLYRVRCWVKAENVQSLHIKFIASYVYPKRDKPVIRWIHPLLHGPEHKRHKSGTWEWEEWEATIAVPEFVERGRVEFWVREWTAPATLYCDDMSVTEVGPYPFFKRRRKELK